MHNQHVIAYFENEVSAAARWIQLRKRQAAMVTSATSAERYATQVRLWRDYRNAMKRNAFIETQKGV